MSQACVRWSAALLAAVAIGAIANGRAARAWRPVGVWAPPSTSWSSPPLPVLNRWRSWNPIPIARGVSGFWASAPNDVWAWGGAEIMRWNGRAWTRVDVPVKQAVKAIWGAPNDVWVRAWDFTPRSGGGHLIEPGHVDTSLLHWDGRAWSSVESRSLQDDRHMGYERPPDFVRKLAPPPDVDSVVNREELIMLWKRQLEGRDLPVFTSGYRTGEGEIWARSETGYQVGHFDGHGWTISERLTSGDFCALQMTGKTDGWALSQSPSPTSARGREPSLGGPVRDGLFRWDGRAWRFVRAVPERMHRLWASGPADMWAIGEAGLVMHWNGVRWSEQRLAGNLVSISGRARDDIWINGCADNAYHWNGSAWSRVPSQLPDAPIGACLAQVPRNQGASIAALWSTPSNGDLWAVGAEGAGPGFDGWPLIVRRSAGSWSQLPTPRTEGSLLAVWGDRDDDVWAVGTKGLVLHWDGTTWRQEDSGVVEPLRAVHGAGGTAWIVGDRGTVLVRALATHFP